MKIGLIYELLRGKGRNSPTNWLMGALIEVKPGDTNALDVFLVLECLIRRPLSDIWADTHLAVDGRSILVASLFQWTLHLAVPLLVELVPDFHDPFLFSDLGLQFSELAILFQLPLLFDYDVVLERWQIRANF